MPDLVERLGSIRKLGQEGTASPSPIVENKQGEQPRGDRPSRSEGGRSIHIRLAQQQVKKLDLLRLSAKSSRTSIIEQAIEEYLSSDQVRKELDEIKKLM